MSNFLQNIKRVKEYLLIYKISSTLKLKKYFIYIYIYKYIEKTSIIVLIIFLFLQLLLQSNEIKR